MTRRARDPDLTKQEKDVLRRLETNGWFVNLIAADESGACFAYSFGLYETFRHPEIILYGLPPETMHELINEVGAQARKGVRYAAGDRTHDLLEKHVCQFGTVDPYWYKSTLTWASWFYDSTDFPSLQLFWPDRNGRFPSDAGCDETVRNLQPDLSKPTG